jgi:hypothetical protein
MKSPVNSFLPGCFLCPGGKIAFKKAYTWVKPMTAQMTDSCLMEDQHFSIVGLNGSELFDPHVHEMNPLPRITSCWRGYVCTYKTLHNKLLLSELKINLGQPGPVLNDVSPVFEPKSTFDNIYGELNLSMGFTGGILIAYGFLRELYVHMGFHPAWKYETVFELNFSQGNMIERRDISQQMAELRHKMTRQPLQPGADASKQELEAWIASTFKMDYRF